MRSWRSSSFRFSRASRPPDTYGTAGAELADLAELARQMRQRSAGPDGDRDQDGFDDRWARLDVTFGGAGSLTNMLLLYTFHHLIAVHRRGWAITLAPDGTVTAVSPDDGRVLHSHSPPAHAA